MLFPAQRPSHLNRREALQTVALATAAAAGGLSASAAPAAQTINASAPNTNGFWPNGARLAVSLSLMFEGGGQPVSVERRDGHSNNPAKREHARARRASASGSGSYRSDRK